MAEYRRDKHTIYNIEYHYVWVTKYRYHVLKGDVALRARGLIRQKYLSRGITIEVSFPPSSDNVSVSS